MQEEVTQKTIALVIKTATLDANVLKAATEEQTCGFCGENITIQAYSHYNCFRKKKIIQPEKQKGIHSEKSKQTIEADCRFSGEISDYLYTALKGWGIWVSNRLPGK